jgi:hypothetical protein
LNTIKSNIVDKLALQVDSFQEGFEILSRSKSVGEIGKQFATLLRGNFLVSDIDIFHKIKSNDEWKLIYGNDTSRAESFENIDEDKLHISYNDNSDNSVCIVKPLIDNSILGVTIGAKLDN